ADYVIGVNERSQHRCSFKLERDILGRLAVSSRISLTIVLIWPVRFLLLCFRFTISFEYQFVIG
ncbi:hypothetical protein DYB87_16820, partial [Vibrio cholerae]|nr:hypothetical protein [Vibrio cholerae]